MKSWARIPATAIAIENPWISLGRPNDFERNERQYEPDRVVNAEKGDH